MIHPDLRRAGWAGALAAILLAAGANACGAAETFAKPLVRISADGRTASMRLDVLTFNIEGVPLRSGRKSQLAEIGRRLAALREAGREPDIVLFQEAFSDDAKAALRAAGYPSVAAGPKRGQEKRLPRAGSRKGSEWTKGELAVPLLDSGLAVASRYPISERAAEPFSRRSCAGYDCLSNKGAAFARIAIPGLPDELDIFDTHMNAQRASGVSVERHLSAHEAQAMELDQFVAQRRDPENPAILGGDFNMRGSAPRFSFFSERQPMDLVHRYCAARRGDCEVGLNWDTDTPWMQTQDLQFFKSGARVSIRPVRVEAMFDGRPDSPRLSDHDGFRVTYELSWTLPRTEIAQDAAPVRPADLVLASAP